jgi:amino acid adenylation domain-containing protein
MDPNTSDAYIIQRIVKLDSTLRHNDLLDAWSRVVKHHSILRAQFTFRSGEPGLVHLETWAPEAVQFSEVKDEELAEALYQREYETPFAFDATTPLWRLHTVKTGHQLTVCLCVHHTIADQLTLSILLQDFDRALNGVPLPTTQGFYTYLEWLHRQDFSHLEHKWRSYVEPLKEATLLPEESSLKPSPQCTSVRFSIPIDAALLTDLYTFANNHDITVNTILLGAWAFILSRLTFRSTVCFGVVRAGRANSLPDAKSMAGLFIKTLPFIQSVPEESTPANYLQDVRQRWKFLYEVDHCPQELLNRWTGHASYSHLLSTIFNFFIQDPHFSGHTNGDSLIRSVRNRHNKVMEPTLGMKGIGSALKINLITPDNHKSFCQTAAQALPHVLRQLITSHAPLHTLSLCPDQKPTLLERFQGPQKSYSEQTLASLVERALSRYATETAFDGIQRKTFAELDHDSNAIAARLTDLPHSATIAICLPAGPQCITAVLAAIRTGHPFICLNPDNPLEDTLQILNTTNPGCVLTHNIQLEASSWNTLQFPETLPVALPLPRPTIHPNDLAYLVHTSGSTGTPKVIQIEQHSVANLIQSIQPIYGLGPGDRRFQRAQPGPDFFIAEMLIPLCSGATLVFSKTAGALTPTEFFTQIEQHRITIASVPSSYWRELVNNIEICKNVKIPSSLRLMIVGMETVDPDALRTWNRLVPKQIELLNVYGPAETTMIATTCSLRKKDPGPESPVPIGTPLPNTAVYILDRASQLLPQGTIGEICIAGAGLMRGYADRKPQEALFPNSNATHPSLSEIYKTGDFGYLNTDGEIVFSGRRDGQVKIRGHRIELGTVERHLSDTTGGSRAIALVIQRGRQNRLIGLVESENSLTSEDVRNTLQQRVKDAFIPSTILFFKIFPQLPNGKINRQLLQKQVEQKLAEKQPVQPPQNHPNKAALTKLISIWNRMFEIQDCSAESNFFELGGDSLLAVSLFATLEREFGVALPITTLVEYPTISALATRMDSNRPDDEWSCLIPLKPAGTRPPLILLHGVFGQVLSFKNMVEHLHADLPVYALQSELLKGRFIQLTTIEAMARSYIEEIRAVYPSGPYALGGFSFGGMLAFEIARQLHEDGETICNLFIFDSKPPRNAPEETCPPQDHPIHNNSRAMHPVPEKTVHPFKRRLEQLLADCRQAKKNVSCRLMHVGLRMGLKLSKRQQKRYIGWHHHHAASRYIPTPYPADITLIHTPKNADHKITAWQRCTMGTLNHLLIDGLHKDLFKTPMVQTLARLVDQGIESWAESENT